jgi:hypothetical protein
MLQCGLGAPPAAVLGDIRIERRKRGTEEVVCVGDVAVPVRRPENPALVPHVLFFDIPKIPLLTGADLSIRLVLRNFASTWPFSRIY